MRYKIKTKYIDFLHKHSFYELDKYFDKNTNFLNIPSKDIDGTVEEVGNLLFEIGITNDEINEDGLILEDIIDVLNVFE